MEHKDEKRIIYSIGGNGLIGSRISELLGNTYTIYNIGTSQGVNITKPHTLSLISDDRNAGNVLLLSAKSDVDSCERDKTLGENGEAWEINVKGVENVIEACKKGNKKLIYVSTDFVFDGKKGSYSEEDTPNPKKWYGVTKREGELRVQHAGIPFLIIRPAFPYRKPFDKKKDFVQAILTRLRANETVLAIKDQVITPTFIDDFAYVLDALIAKNEQGIFHVVGDGSLSPYDAASLIATTYQCNNRLIQSTTREEFYKDRAFRPFDLSMKNDRIKKLGFKMSSFKQGLKTIKKQEDDK